MLLSPGLLLIGKIRMASRHAQFSCQNLGFMLSVGLAIYNSHILE